MLSAYQKRPCIIAGVDFAHQKKLRCQVQQSPNTYYLYFYRLKHTGKEKHSAPHTAYCGFLID